MPHSRRVARTPGALPDELCAKLPFAAGREACGALLDREQAAHCGQAHLSPAEHAALQRLHHATAVLLCCERTLADRGRQPVGGRALHGDGCEVVLALLWRAERPGCDPYAVQLARHIDGRTTWLPASTGLRVDVAWPRYRQLRWPTAPRE